MLADQIPVSIGRNPSIFPSWFVPGIACFLSFLGLTLSAQPLLAEDAQGGAWIVVGETVDPLQGTQIRSATLKALNESARNIVYEFRGSGSSNYHTCAELADLIVQVGRGYQDEKRRFDPASTFAFVPRGVKLKGHAVLIALACRKLYMGPDAEIGFDRDALQRAQIGQLQVDQYLKIVEDRAGVSPAFVVKMLDPEQKVLSVTKDNAKSYKLSRPDGNGYRLTKEFVDEWVTQEVGKEEVMPSGTEGLYTTQKALSYGLCERQYNSHEELRSGLGIPASAIHGNPLEGLRPLAAVIEIDGEIDTGLRESVARKIREAINKQANILIFQIHSLTGDVEAASDLQKEIQDIGRGEHSDFKGKRVKTIAYIPSQAHGASTFLIFACQDIIVGPQASFGNCESIVFKDKLDNQGGRVPIAAGKIEAYAKSLGSLMEIQGHSRALADALLRTDVEVVQVIPRNAEGERHGLPRFEVADKVDKARFEVKAFKSQGKLIPGFNAEEAQRLGIALHKAEDLKSISGHYGFDMAEVIYLRSGWVDMLVTILVHPVTTVFLVIIGFTCLILEFKAPGLGLPAILAAVCFLLLFWAYFFKGGVNWLALLLFLLGLVLLAVELFVLPGFGIAGISGIVLLLLSFTLLMVEKWPQTPDEYATMGRNFGIFSAGLLISLVTAYMLARLLPSVPIANRLMLPPPEEEAVAGGSLPPAQSPALLGAIGVVVTALRPAGKARFDDQFIDVVAEGHYVEVGMRVQVIEIDGMRVVVKSV
jgi:membrane-bound ClpP family serine protease